MQEKQTLQFFRSGGVAQVVIANGEDIGALPLLNQKLWLALSCPTKGVHFPQQALAVLDRDQDGKIRAAEIIDWVEWLRSVLKDLNVLTNKRAALSLDWIREDTESGHSVRAAARLVRSHLSDSSKEPGVAEEEITELTLADVATAKERVIEAKENGDGIVPITALSSQELQSQAEIIISVVGSELGLDCKSGLSTNKVDEFITVAKTYLEWEAEGKAGAAEVTPFGAATGQVYSAFSAVAEKIDDYFIRNQLATYLAAGKESDRPSLISTNISALESLAHQNLNKVNEVISNLPISQREQDGSLSLNVGINPAWRDKIDTFKHRVVTPLYGASEILSDSMWRETKERFVKYESWIQKMPSGALVEAGPARIGDILDGEVISKIRELISADLVVKPSIDALKMIEDLLILLESFLPFVRNFVSFSDFYTGQGKGVFQAGSLYLDGRCCDLCVWVDDVDSHSKLASLSDIYLAYCKLTRAASAETKFIAACFTGGEASNLMVGRNGVFYDRDGKDWDATIVKIIDKPISLREAFWLPYRRLGRFVSEQIEKFARAKDQAVATGGDSLLANTVQGAQGADKAPPSPPFDIGRFAGIFAAIGLAIGAIGTSLASIISGFLTLVWWQMPLAILGLALVISGPSMLLAWLKLRRRNLSPLLDACGWAINTQARLNFALGSSLTSIATVPARSLKSIPDPFQEKQSPIWRYLVSIIILGGLAGGVWWLKQSGLLGGCE